MQDRQAGFEFVGGAFQNAVYTHGIMRSTQIVKAVIKIVEIISGMIPEKICLKRMKKIVKKQWRFRCLFDTMITSMVFLRRQFLLALVLRRQFVWLPMMLQ